MNSVKSMRIAVVAYLLLLCSISIDAQNHELSQHLTKLSEWEGQDDVDDYVPEMEIVGQNIHTIWVRYVSGDEGYLYYRRSTDLGETWEAPKLIHKYKSASRAKSFEHRKLAVEGEKVYIATSDYDYSDNGTGRVFFYESVNAGGNFNAGRVISQNEGGYRAFSNSLIKVKNGRIAIAYQGSGSGIRKGTRFLFSSNGGASFTDTLISEESDGLSDLYFNGEQAIVLHNYTFYNNGLHTGRVWVSTTNDGQTFTTNKISQKFTTTYGESEKSLSRQFENYSSKIAKSGNNIVVVFEGTIREGVWTILYARSTNNGLTFEEIKDLNNGVARIETPKETVAAANGTFYIAYQSYSKDYKFYFSKSTDNGATFSQPINLMPTDLAHVGNSNLPNIVIDPQDQTGKTFYITGNWFYSIKTTDGGNSFSHYQMLAPSLQSVMYDRSYGNCSSWMKVDSEGQKHWISKTLYRFDQISDILYRNIKQQPEPGKINKSFYVETKKEDQYKLDQIVIPDNPTIRVDSAMTVEVWVRFRTGNDNQYDIISSIFTKLNGAAGYYDDTPDGYHLAFRKEKNLIQLNSGLKTDKGSFVNWSNIDLNDNLWHHVAITYDARAGKNNYKIYINGLLNKQQTVTGKVYEDVGMMILGSSNMTYSPRQIKYDIDDFRLWNKALSQEEIIGNQTAKLTGQEEGLLLFLNFDDTYKDLTGRGNDGIPVYDGRLEQSDFDAPLAAFDVFRNGKSVSINNNTKNGSSWLWNFGDETTSTQGNPVHDYAQPGEYQLSLLAKNSTTITSAMAMVAIKGLSNVEPKEAVNIGDCILNIYGGGLKPSMNIVLRIDQNTEIEADTIVGFEKDGFLQALFTIDGAKEGIWDVVVIDNGIETILPKSFNIKNGNGYSEPWVNVSGRGSVLLNRWTKFTITYGNKGNIDALMVPISFAVPEIDGLEVDFVDFEIVLPAEAYMYNLQEILMPIKDYFVTDTLFGMQKQSRVYSVLIPRVKANSSDDLHILIKSPSDYTITSWTGNGWLLSAEGQEKSTLSQQYKSSFTENEEPNEENNNNNKEIAYCLIEGLAWTTIETAIGVIPTAGAIYNSFKTGYTVGQFDTKNVKKSLVNTSLQSVSTFFSYTSVVPVIGWVAGTVGGMICGGISAIQTVTDCLSLAENTKGISTVSSFDPNEIIGPSGFGEKGWIANLNEMPYTILFENKKEATAPAHDVFITDSLDLSVFDINKFGFGAFGWGDSIFFPLGNNLKSFSMDVDLRPEMPLITRVSGKLDTITGIITWEFLSLNPETMDIEEDPFIGFLPPNKTSPEGEGFVSYTVGLKTDLKTNDELRNKATIVFDANPPIVTNEFLNTLDFDAPTSQVTQLKNNNFSFFDVNWTGADNGSGIQHYTIYVLENDTLLYNWLQNTTEQSGTFKGTIGSTYKFYSLATDNVSLMEPTKNGYEAQTTVIVGVDEQAKKKATWNAYPNPVKDFVTIQFNNPDCGVYVVEIVSINGARQHSALYTDDQMQQGISIDTRHLRKGTYLLRVISEQQAETQKLVIQ